MKKQVVSVRKTPVVIPAKRCCAPGCGDKIKPCEPDDWMYEVTWDDGSVSHVEENCAGWVKDGHPDYGCGWGVDLEALCN